MKGKIINHQREIYYVSTDEGVIGCKARGLFRKDDIRPIVGDNVIIRISEEDGSGYIEEVLERKNILPRPSVSNVDQALAVFSIEEPKINLNLVDKNLLMLEYMNINSSIVFTKIDLIQDEILERYLQIYKSAGYEIFLASDKDSLDQEKIRKFIENKISVFFGPSGVGKTSLINRLTDKNLETSSVSEKTRRGRHTTRHVELIPVDSHTFILDTPGFSSLGIDFIDEEIDIQGSVREFQKYRHECRFDDCLHLNEPGCGIKSRLGGDIAQSRYDSYLNFIEEFRNIRRY